MPVKHPVLDTNYKTLDSRVTMNSSKKNGQKKKKEEEEKQKRKKKKKKKEHSPRCLWSSQR